MMTLDALLTLDLTIAHAEGWLTAEQAELEEFLEAERSYQRFLEEHDHEEYAQLEARSRYY